MTPVEILKDYIRTLINAGIDVPAEVRAAIETLWQAELGTN